ncbi:MAG: DcaP family trimeric outer membrane transporter [Asticcacaulis sp.]
MSIKAFRTLCLASAAAGVLLPAAALAQQTPKQSTEARLSALEQAMSRMQAELDAARAENAQLKTEAAGLRTQTHTISTDVIALKTAPPPPPPPVPEGFRNGATTVKIGGFLKTVATFSRWQDGDAAANTLGRDFYLPQAIPVGGTREGTDSDISAKQTRLWMNFDTAVAGHTLKGYLETDFQTAAGSQGSERTTNGYNLALRRAYVQYDRLTIGQDWTTFQNVAALPESTDFVGPTEGTVFVRQPLIRYSLPLDKGTVLHLAAENAETATTTLGSAALVENDDDRMPDLTARLHHSGAFGEMSLAGVLRQLSIDNGKTHDDTVGYGLSAAGRFVLDADKGHDLRVMATWGSGIGRYVGLNFAPDAVFDPTAKRLKRVDTLAALAAFKTVWAPGLRSTLMAGYQDASYSGDYAPTVLGAVNDRAWSVAGNLFWSPVKGLDLGVEYRHGERKLVSGAKGRLDRLEFAAKYNF